MLFYLFILFQIVPIYILPILLLSVLWKQNFLVDVRFSYPLDQLSIIQWLQFCLPITLKSKKLLTFKTTLVPLNIGRRKTRQTLSTVKQVNTYIETPYNYSILFTYLKYSTRQRVPVLSSDIHIGKEISCLTSLGHTGSDNKRQGTIARSPLIRFLLLND